MAVKRAELSGLDEERKRELLRRLRTGELSDVDLKNLGVARDAPPKWSAESLRRTGVVLGPDGTPTGVRGSALKSYRDMVDWAGQHKEKFGEDSINLSPSENVVSDETVRAATEYANRYFFSEPLEVGGMSVKPRGMDYMGRILELTEKTALRMFSADEVELGVVSGHLADMAVLMKFLNPGDKVLCVDPAFGGYGGFAKDNLPRTLGIKEDDVLYTVHNPETGEFDLEATLGLIDQHKPKLIILGSSVELFPYPTAAVRSHIKQNNIMTAQGETPVIVYDVSHTMGLMFGSYPNPLVEGADVIIGGTSKTLPAASSGVMASTRNWNKDVSCKISPLHIADNTQNRQNLILGLTLLEMMAFGREYGRQVVSNSQALAKALDSRGMPVRFRGWGYTMTHQILFDVGNGEGQIPPERFSLFTDLCEPAGINHDGSGRMGTQELTRRGMKEDDMRTISGLMLRVYEISGLDVPDERKRVMAAGIKPEVKKFRSMFTGVTYSFDRIMQDVEGG